jgi:hypothetical protein
MACFLLKHYFQQESTIRHSIWFFHDFARRPTQAVHFPNAVRELDEMFSYSFRTRTTLMLSLAFFSNVGSLLWAGEIADLHRKWVRPKEKDPAPQMARF